MAHRGMSLKARATAAVALCRPLNCALTAASAMVGALTADARALPMHALGAPLAAALAAALLTGAGNAFNDVIDVRIDVINRPQRPLPAGRLSRAQALTVSAAAAGVGVGVAFSVGWGHGMVALAVTGLLAHYSLTLKRTPLWGNLLVAGLAASVFPFGATSIGAGAWGRSWIPAGFALLFHLGREIIKDMEDVQGDRAGEADTLAVRHGPGPARRVATVLLLALIAFTLAPWILGLYGTAYGIIITVLAGLILHVLVQLHRLPAMLNAGPLGRELKLGMLVGLAAIAIAEFVR